ncbi:hypothetical protein Pth03_50870 [Planotetraspora thailandica]|uniref:Fibronectin type-III domain-containing protein n=1 Tax=Planotetraspora thailandica TaxID=487172 RepID=A0A8J3V3E2_9ACTN|nr:Ig-like domain repeat protein [Planotetraspora thailandica]GII56698.1 hypothetical protein Pth03_50870 [Planotetraspora thailandica]
MRSKRYLAAATASLAAVATAGSLTFTGAAYADPPAGNFRTFVGVGSDTIQDVMNALAGDSVNGKAYPAVTGNGDHVASYDAVEPGTLSTTSKIQTRVRGKVFARPNGSGNGRKALSSSLTGTAFLGPDGVGVTIPGQVDFARSSGAPSVSGTTLTYVPLARDAVGVAVKGSALQNLSRQQLHDIYSSTTPTVDGTAVHPFLPQSGSGTRSFFLNAIGLTESTIATGIPTVQENQAKDPAFIDADNVLVPFSVGSWIAQRNGVSPDNSSAGADKGVTLASIKTSDSATTFTAPFTTEAGKLAANPVFYNDPTFGRDVYNVVPSRAIDPSSVFYDDSLYDIFVTEGAHKAATASADSQNTIAAFGFLNEPYNGSIDPSNHAKLGGLEDGSSNAAPGAPQATITPATGSVKVSWTAPTVNPGLPVTDYRVVLTGSTGAFVAEKDVTAATSSFTFTGLAAGKYNASVFANNLGGSSVGAVARGVSKVTASAATTAYGQTGHVSITVTDTNSVVPTGKVTVKEGSTTIGTATLVNGKASVAVKSSLSVGTHTFSVAYSGDSALNPASVTVKKVVTKATPTVTSSAPTKVSTRSHAKVTVAVKASGFVPTGSVRIYEGTKVIATGTLKSGKVVVTLPLLKKGRHVLHATYVGTSTTNAKAGKSFAITAS